MEDDTNPLSSVSEAWQRLYYHLLDHDGLLAQIERGQEIKHVVINEVEVSLTVLRNYWVWQQFIPRKHAQVLWETVMRLEMVLKSRKKEYDYLIRELINSLSEVFINVQSIVDEVPALEVLQQHVLGGPSFSLELSQGRINTHFFHNLLFHVEQLRGTWEGKQELSRYACAALFAIEQIPWSLEIFSEDEQQELVRMRQELYQRVDACFHDYAVSPKPVAHTKERVETTLQLDAWRIIRKHFTEHDGLLAQLDQGREIQVTLGDQQETSQDLQEIKLALEMIHTLWGSRDMIPKWQVCLLWHVVPRVEIVLGHVPTSFSLHLLQAKILLWIENALGRFDQEPYPEYTIAHDITMHIKALRGFSNELRFGRIDKMLFDELFDAVDVLCMQWKGRPELPRYGVWLLFLIPSQDWDGKIYTTEQGVQLAQMKQRLYAHIGECFCERGE